MRPVTCTRRRTAAVIAFLAMIYLTGPVSKVWAQGQSFQVPQSAWQSIFNQTNAYRQQKGLAALKQSAAANAVAQQYAEFLARADASGHEADGRKPMDRLKAGGVQFCGTPWENYHGSWTTPAMDPPESAVTKAMNFWKTSPGHEANLRSPSTHLGVGIAGARHGDRWVYKEIQLFFDTTCLPGGGAGTPSPVPSGSGGTVPGPSGTPVLVNRPGDWSAFATNGKGRWGYGVHRIDQLVASDLAVNGCGGAGQGCKVFWTTKDRCVSYAESRKGGYWYAAGGGATGDQARQNAIRFCQSGSAPATSCATTGAWCR